MDEQHIYHHSEGAKVTVKAEKNSRGWNYEASVSGASSVAEAMQLLTQATEALKKEYGEQA